jgi:hypothetical protein
MDFGTCGPATSARGMTGPVASVIIMDCEQVTGILAMRRGLHEGRVDSGRAHDGCSSSLIMAIQLWGASSPSMMP